MNSFVEDNREVAEEGIQMTLLQWDGNRFSEEATNPRGVKAPAF